VKSLLRINALTLLSAAALAATGCDSNPAVGTFEVALSSDAAFFRLRIFEAPPAADLAGDTAFDTGCIQQLSRTYELTNIPVGTGYAVAYEGFSKAGCEASDRVALGYRGQVTIAADQTPYYHLQVYPEGAVATLPEDLNLSASQARSVDFCDDAADCGGAREVCYDAAKPEYWCVPTCDTDLDCSGIHPRSVCDTATHWCMLHTPFPLNLSTGRAFGAATTLGDGDVVFVGGLDQGSDGRFVPARYPLERFDAQTGLFASASVSGVANAPGGEFGFVDLGGDRVVTVGGLRSASLEYTAEQGLALSASWSDALSADVIVWDLANGVGRVTALSRAVMRPTVVGLGGDRFFVAGGLVVAGPGVEPTKSTSVCTVSSGTATCDPGPLLQAPRQGAAATCLDMQCRKVLLIGGNPGGKLAEVVDLEANLSTALKTKGFGEKVFGPILCGQDLVGGSLELARSVPFAPVRFTLKTDEIEANPIAQADPASYLAAVVGNVTGFGQATSCTLAGGIAGQATTAAIRVDAEGTLTALEPTLGMARFGAVAARIGAGPLEGKILFAGGVGLPTSGPVSIVRGAEVLSQ
jgi:hypothetical protein